jgi:hypothetical protein
MMFFCHFLNNFGLPNEGKLISTEIRFVIQPLKILHYQEAAAPYIDIVNMKNISRVHQERLQDLNMSYIYIYMLGSMD